ncbi:MAG: MBL fold metallo-hydrolase [Planctomycetota bacterium]
MTKPPLTITGYSTALFSTWYFISEMGILFDCGDGVVSGLNQKSRKIKHVFISHADRDHVCGLLQFNQLNARNDLNIYYPKDCGSFPRLAEFSAKFDPHVSGTRWIPLDSNQEIKVRDDLLVRAIDNQHVMDKPGVKSLTYIVESASRKLKPEFADKSPSELGILRKQLGRDGITDESRKTQLIYSGDTPIESDGRYDDAQILIHEATFLTTKELGTGNPHRNKHSSLEQVMEMVAESNVQTLILGHFSSRYSFEQIEKAIRHEKTRRKIEIPVFALMPGNVARNVLALEPF